MSKKKEQKNIYEQEFLKKVELGCINISNKNSYCNLKKGDLVLLFNDFGEEVGPYKILGFDEKNNIFLNWDCYWHSISFNKITKKYTICYNKDNNKPWCVSIKEKDKIFGEQVSPYYKTKDWAKRWIKQHLLNLYNL